MTVDRLARLQVLADDLRIAFEMASVGVKAQIAAQYRATLAEIEEIETNQPERKGTALDELRARRAARQPGAARQA